MDTRNTGRRTPIDEVDSARLNEQNCLHTQAAAEKWKQKNTQQQQIQTSVTTTTSKTLVQLTTVRIRTTARKRPYSQVPFSTRCLTKRDIFHMYNARLRQLFIGDKVETKALATLIEAVAMKSRWHRRARNGVVKSKRVNWKLESAKCWWGWQRCRRQTAQNDSVRYQQATYMCCAHP